MAGLVSPVLRTWGPKGLLRRGAHEVGRRSGYLQRRENAYLRCSYDDLSLQLPGLVTSGTVERPWSDEVGLYGALTVPVPAGGGWHVHPLTGNRFSPDRHWSSFSDADPAAGDIKDIWELGRLTWLLPRAISTSAAAQDRALEAVRDWMGSNPAYRGPHWMCAQETSLRGIVLALTADALRDRLQPEDRAHVAVALARSIDRVRLTLRYAMSQRNNHAISEAGFLWGMSVLLDHPDAARLRRQAERSLQEAIRDQFMPDGSYAQHSPTYQRLALHVLLWCLRVGNVTGIAPPHAVQSAVERSVGFLLDLMVPGSEGRMPNLGGNDGALLFDLTTCGIEDFRPLLVHASAALGRPSPFPPGPWDQEAVTFGYEPRHDPTRAVGAAAREAVHPLTAGSMHGVLRAGPLHHRPSHADQLHFDVWIDGKPVAVDPGSYRYTAPAPWGNALAEETVHNLPTRPGVPQAVRAGRFFWKRWAEAEIVFQADDERPAVLSRLELPDGTVLLRLAAVTADQVLVIDQAEAAVHVRWNLPADVEIDHRDGRGRLRGPGWRGAVWGGSAWSAPAPDENDPESGWHAPTYGVLEPLQALIVASDEHHRVVTTFGPAEGSDVEALLERCRTLDLRHVNAAAVQAALAGEDR